MSASSQCVVILNVGWLRQEKNIETATMRHPIFRLTQLLAASFLFLLPCSPVRSQERAVNSSNQATTAPPVTKDATTTAPMSVQKIVELRKHIGSEVTVVGHVSRATKSGSGHQFLNFQASELSVVCFKDDLGSFTKGQPADLYKGKRVEVQGKLELYKNKLQIKLREPSQIRLAKAASTATSKQSVAEYLKKTGKETWISPAGLTYTGRDPAGLTRVDHVLRHARDIPNRRGSHGVFDGEDATAFQVIDEAWKLAKKRRTKPVVEGDRSTLTVNLGRRIGYLGGTTGKQRRNPPLKRVFIVLRTNTQQVITAFPK